MDSRNSFHDIVDYSPVGLDVMDSNADTQLFGSQLEYGSLWNSDFPTSFAPDFMDSDMTMPSTIDTSLSAPADSTFDFNAGSIAGFQQPSEETDSMLANTQDSFYVPSKHQHNQNRIPGLSGASVAWTAQVVPETSPIGLSATSSTPFDFCDIQQGSVGKRPFQADFQDFPRPKRQMASEHQGANYLTPESLTFASSDTTRIEGETPITGQSHYQLSQSDSALDEDAADVCSTWFSKRYSVFPGDKDIAALSHLTRMPAGAIRNWFGEFLARGLHSENDSAYMSQNSNGDSIMRLDLQQGEKSNDLDGDWCRDANTTPAEEIDCTENLTRKSGNRFGKKSCTPTSSPDLLCRDEGRIYQCTRKCGKRYVRKCDWKRNEQEGYPSKHWLCSLCQTLGLERAKPCYRRYHFTQHFNNIHPTFSAVDYEADSLVEAETAFPRQCGFCPHVFSSRQERIDHIAEHFKQGKCMLDWDDGVQEGDSSSDDDSGDDDAPGDDGSKDKENFEDNTSARSARREIGGKRNQFNGEKGGPDTDGSGDTSGGSYRSLNSGASWESRRCASINCIDTESQPVLSSSPWQDAQQRSTISTHPPGQTPVCSTTTSPGLDEHAIYRSPTLNDASVQHEAYSLGVHLTGATEPCSLNPKSKDLPFPCCDSGPLLSELELCDYVAKAPIQRSSLSAWSKDDHGRHPDEGILACRVSGKSNDGDSVRIVWQASRDAIAIFGISKTCSPLSDRIIASTWGKGYPVSTSRSFLSIKFLGMGGFSTVEEVIHRETGLRICRKTVRPQRKMLPNDIMQEVDILQQLRHPHIIRLLESYTQGDRLSILLSPVADMTLSVWLENYSGKAPVGGKETVLQMFGCLTSSVRYLHEQRPLVAHTDIKPQNILIVQGKNEFPHVILSDFGISRASNDHVAEQDFGPMTPRYCAPEVASHTARGPEADIWSLGCVFLEMALVVRENKDELHQGFRKEFAGGKFYYKDVPRVHWWLDRLRETKPAYQELLVLETVKAMLDVLPESRPDASSLASVFTPGSCCLAWPSTTQRFPGPLDEAKACAILLDRTAIESPIAASVSSFARHELRFHNASDWLQTCAAHHHSCQYTVPEGEHARTLPARFLDLHSTVSKDTSVHVVATSALPSSTAYVALSYLWSATDELLLTSRNTDALFGSISVDALSKPVADAISVTKQLGLRYLWVDALCVLQDSPADRRQECAKMMDLYRNAIVTIAAKHGSKSPENGAGSQPSADIDDLTIHLTPDASWDTRAWSQQERILSKRTLYLTDDQLYWECPSLKASDTLPRGLPSLLWESVHCHEEHSCPVGLV
ncbi:uncharacterized protein BDZ99DRAFT_419053 [Mytilinidion resinicola]|uniref:Protein kinase domain-containing protein n=1 Tax=Mytilinidion resinicola TaxID=574789 RepID=A0A6A6YH95_9PEZI|nr:uncharacterized protein BDZ99DRAFT_419053 [Mytilinidion resinicola]KAF2808192.1 hypothetical protein BDZ99DRAFT_419053 [Mytilinidion resinicola]